jgi:endonuclease G
MAITRIFTIITVITLSLFGFESRFLPDININIKCTPLLHKTAMDICYSCKNKEPKMVVYEIDGSKISQHHYSRKGLNFRPDYNLPNKCRSYTKDYSKTGFDRGHNAPNADFSYSKKLQKETFLLSNISPEKPKLNRKLWAKIEKFTRYQAKKYGKVQVVTGSCGSLGHIRHGVNIPAYWYKIIFLPKGKTVSFLAPNTNTGMVRAKARDYLSSIKEITNTCKINM